ncbi:uncharacterized protein TNCV_3643181 [Trichonephila clavipes]|nr:uncharacterized protein TNCV_3643181 [Trichonephila clavipes]
MANFVWIVMQDVSWNFMYRAHKPVQCSGRDVRLQTTARLLLHCCGHFFNYRRINSFPPSTRLPMERTCLIEFLNHFLQTLGNHQTNTFFHNVRNFYRAIGGAVIILVKTLYKQRAVLQ